MNELQKSFIENSSSEDVDLANYMFASNGDIWSKEEWARAEQIIDEEDRKRKKK